MSNDYSNFGRKPVSETSGLGGTRLYLVVGGAVILASLVGALVAVLLMRTPAAAPQQAAANRPAAGQPASGQAQAPIQWTKVGTYGSWEVRCQNNAAKTCAAWLDIVNQQNKQVLMSWIVGPDGKGALETVFQTPTGVRVSAGLDVKLGNASARHINYINCLPRQCTAGAPIDDTFLKDAVAAQKAEVTLYSPDGKGVNFGIPVTGLDKAVAALKK